MVLFKETIDQLQHKNNDIEVELIKKFQLIEKAILSITDICDLFDTVNYCKNTLYNFKIHSFKIIGNMSFALNINENDNLFINIEIPGMLSTIDIKEKITLHIHIFDNDIRYETNYGWGVHYDNIFDIVKKSKITYNDKNEYKLTGLNNANGNKACLPIKEEFLCQMMEIIKDNLPEYCQYVLSEIKEQLNKQLNNE